MDYKKYIDLGFERAKLTCPVEFSKSGYYGYSLSKKLNEKMFIEVAYPDLDKPKLYVSKGNETHHIIPITTQIVIDLLK
jgi:hypothetical protein